MSATDTVEQSEPINPGDQLDPSQDAATSDEAPIDEIAGELANTATQYDAAVNAEKRAEGVFDDADAVFDGPFDVEKAWAVVSRVNDEYQDAIREEKRTAELHKDAKKSRDALGERVSKLIADYNGRKNDGPQPFLRTVDEHGVTLSNPCSYERTYKKPCPVCRVKTNGSEQPAPSEDTASHPEHTSHAEFAANTGLTQLSEALQRRHAYLATDVLAFLVPEQIELLHTWAASSGPVPPDVLIAACVSGEPGANGAFCTRCGCHLGRISDTQDYPEGSFVGLDCAGPEEARSVSKRGARKGRAKPDHDGEREQQEAEGKKREQPVDKA